MERRSKDKVDIVTQHTFANYPSQLKKKVILLEHFNSYLDGIDLDNLDKNQILEDQIEGLGKLKDNDDECLGKNFSLCFTN